MAAGSLVDIEVTPQEKHHGMVTCGFFCVSLFPTFWEGCFEGLEGMLLGALCSFDPLGTFVMGLPEGIMTAGLELVLTLAPECNLGLSAGIATETFVFEFSSAKRVELLSRIFWGLPVAKLVEVFFTGSLGETG